METQLRRGPTLELTPLLDAPEVSQQDKQLRYAYNFTVLYAEK